jgi:uncharacterized repeat protein (TIGR02543 family)
MDEQTVTFNELSQTNLNTTLNADFNLSKITLTTPANAVSINGTNTLTLGYGGVDLSSSSQNLAISTPVVLSSSQDWRVGSGRTLSFNGGVSGDSVGLNIFGGGKVFLGSLATYAGDTVVSAGTTVQIGLNSALPGGPGYGTVHLDGTLDLNGYSQVVNGLTGNGLIDSTASGTIKLTVSNSTPSVYSGVIRNTAGSLSFAKVGPGALTLSGTNTYSGTTAVESGSLFVNGVLASGGGTVSVSNNAALGGTGTIGRNVTIANGGKLEFDISTAPASHDGLTISSGMNFSFSGASVLTITSASGATPGTYVLITGGNNISGVAPATVNLPANWSATVSISTNSLLLVLNSINGSSYSVTYNGNGATGGSAPVDANSPYAASATVTVLGNTNNLVKTGYAFANWNTATNGSGTSHAPGATFTITTNTNLYAQWTPSSYTVTFNQNGGDTPSPTSKSVTYDATYGSLATVTRTGYTLNGWFTAPSGGVQITSGTTVSITAAQTLYAQWTANSYTVTFDGNGGGTPSPMSKSVTYDSTYGSLATVSRTGYTFNGWFTAASGGTQITSGTSVTITSAQTLYAQWTQDPKLPATVTLGNLSQAYDGLARVVTYTTSPTGLAVTVTYNGVGSAPTNAGYYAVTGTVNSTTYQGSTNGTLVVSQATPVVTNWPTASSIILGQAFSNATLSFSMVTNPVPGSFSYVSPGTVPQVAGITNAAVVFTPADQVNYQTKTNYMVAVLVMDTRVVPFWEPFESREERGLDGQYGWEAESTVVQTNKVYAGAKAAQISGGGGYLKHAFSDNRTKVWTDMRVQVVQSPEKPTPDTNATVSVYVWTNSIVFAFHGTNAVSTGIAIQPGTNVWTRFTTFSDYTTKTYTLYVNDVRVDKYNFYSAAVTNFTELKVSGDATFVDNIGVTPNQPPMKYMPSLILLQ